MVRVFLFTFFLKQTANNGTFNFKVDLTVELCEEAKWCNMCVAKHEVVHAAISQLFEEVNW